MIFTILIQRETRPNKMLVRFTGTRTNVTQFGFDWAKYINAI